MVTCKWSLALYSTVTCVSNIHQILLFKGVEDKYSSHSRHSLVALHQLLSPSSLLHVVERVRSYLVTLKAGSTVVISKPSDTGNTDFVGEFHTTTDSILTEVSDGSEVVI